MCPYGAIIQMGGKGRELVDHLDKNEDSTANHELSAWGGASKRPNNERQKARGQFLVADGV